MYSWLKNWWGRCVLGCRGKRFASALLAASVGHCLVLVLIQTSQWQVRQSGVSSTFFVTSLSLAARPFNITSGPLPPFNIVPLRRRCRLLTQNTFRLVPSARRGLFRKQESRRAATSVWTVMPSVWNPSLPLTELHLGSAQGQSNYWTFTPSETQGLSPSLCTPLHDSPLVLLPPDPPLFCLATQTLTFFPHPSQTNTSFFFAFWFQSRLPTVRPFWPVFSSRRDAALIYQCWATLKSVVMASLAFNVNCLC